MKLLFAFTLFYCIGLSSVSGEVKWMYSFSEAKSKAQKENKLLLVDFYAWWCAPCKKMEKEVWSDPEIGELSENFVPVKVDLDTAKATSNYYKISAIPTIVIMDPFGDVLFRNPGFIKGDYLHSVLSSFPSDVEDINSKLAECEKSPNDGITNYDVGLSFQSAARNLDGEARAIFLLKSDSYLSKAKTSFEEEGSEIMRERSQLLAMVNEAYRGKGKKEMQKFLKKTNEDSLQKENLSSLYYVLAVCSRESGDKKKQQLYLNKLTASQDSDFWLEEWNKGQSKEP